MNWLKALLRIGGPRVVAVLSGVVVAEVAKHGITLDPIETTGLILGTYASVHKAISSKVNPGDASKLRLVEAQKDAVDTNTTVKVEPSK